jgi:hypothetical protein
MVPMKIIRKTPVASTKKRASRASVPSIRGVNPCKSFIIKMLRFQSPARPTNFPPVRAFPIYLSARVTAKEFLGPHQAAGRNDVAHLRTFNPLQYAVATRTTRRSRGNPELFANQFDLIVQSQPDRHKEASKLSGCENPPLEKLSIRRDYEAILAGRLFHEVAILNSRRVARVHAEDTQPARHAAAHGVASDLEIGLTGRRSHGDIVTNRRPPADTPGASRGMFRRKMPRPAHAHLPGESRR